MTLKRGALIVIEGLDRTGKSTQCRALVEALSKRQIEAECTNFPARYTDIGKVVDSYLQSKKELPDEAIHLLFSANRWERAKHIVQCLETGISVIVDRYCYSGVAFSAAKGLDINWCKCSDAGLPKPDKVFFLTMPAENLSQRNGFGHERYEKLDFQKKVSDMYLKLEDDSWEVLDASRFKGPETKELDINSPLPSLTIRSVEEIQEEILHKTVEIIHKVQNKPIGKIWLV